MRTITLSEAHQAARDIVSANPHGINPTWHGGCVYTSPSDDEWHCVVGQWLVNVVGFCPQPEDGENDGFNAHDLLRDGSEWRSRIEEAGFTFNYEVVDFLSELQGAADEAEDLGLEWFSFADRIPTTEGEA